jgi:Mn2+/Fe2+ NRAMP family transporter
MKALLPAIVVFVLAFASLTVMAYHYIRKNHDKSYRWGVWLFSILLAVYAFVTSFGR